MAAHEPIRGARRRTLAGWLALAGLAWPALTVAQEPIRIGWTAWSDGVFVTRLAQHLIEEELDQPVELVRAGIAEQYQGVASGRLDVTLMSLQPRTHGPYVARVASEVEDLGVLYGGAKLGWAVPAFVPADEVASIDDLRAPDNRARFGGRVVGIDPGAGLMRLSNEAVEAYGLDGYSVASGSGPEMTDALADAIDAGDWVVVTAWSPHWMFAAFDLRYLDDPEGALGGSEQVHALARQGLYADHPAVAELLSRMWLPLDALEQGMLDAHRRDHEQAVERFSADHAERVRYWVTGTP